MRGPAHWEEWGEATPPTFFLIGRTPSPGGVGVRVGVSPAPFLSPDWFKPLLRVVGIGVGRLLVTWFQFQDGGLAGDSKFQDGDQFYQPNYYQPINFQTRNSPSDCDVIYSSEA